MENEPWRSRRSLVAIKTNQNTRTTRDPVRRNRSQRIKIIFTTKARRSRRKIFRAKAQRRQGNTNCHFDQREKSFLNPSHSTRDDEPWPVTLRAWRLGGRNPVSTV